MRPNPKLFVDVDLAPWERLAEEMLATGKYNPRGLDAETLYLDCASGRASMCEEKGTDHIIAYGAVEKTNQSRVWQIRKLFVAEEHCGNGNGTAMMADIVRRLMMIVTPPVTHFAITDNPKVVDVLAAHRIVPFVFAFKRSLDIWVEAIGFEPERVPDNAWLRHAARSGMQGRLLLMGHKA